MNKFILLAFSFLCFIPLAIAQDGDVDIKKAENYLRNLSTAKADFIQTAHNGSRLSGTFYLNRPGKLRFEYNEVDDFIVADGLFIYFYDSEMQEQTNAPIGQTLADFLLRKDISLSGDIQVQEAYSELDVSVITIAQADDPSSGSVKLFFQESPYYLKEWQVTDAAGMTTSVKLSNLETGLEFSKRLFAYIAPKKEGAHFNE